MNIKRKSFLLEKQSLLCLGAVDSGVPFLYPRTQDTIQAFVTTVIMGKNRLSVWLKCFGSSFENVVGLICLLS